MSTDMYLLFKFKKIKIVKNKRDKYFMKYIIFMLYYLTHFKVLC